MNVLKNDSGHEERVAIGKRSAWHDALSQAISARELVGELRKHVDEMTDEERETFARLRQELGDLCDSIGLRS